jgi:hypothetical protein
MPPRSAVALRSRLPRHLPREPWSLLVPLVLAQWIGVALFWRAVTHNGWLFYHGGDQTWYYTSSWLLGRGDLPETQIGYGWSFLLTPLTWITGPNFLGGLPAIVVLQVALLLPLGTLVMYGCGARLGGRVVGYVAAAVWALAPFAAIPMFIERYHDRYTAQFAPQVLGLTGLGDWPATLALVVAAYFVFRALDDATVADGVAAGLAAGFAIAIKPSNALFLAAPFVALAAARRLRSLVAFGVALTPFALTLLVWKARGLGSVPLLSAPAAQRVALGGAAFAHDSLVTARLPQSVKLDWGHFRENWDQLQEFFFSARLLEWIPVAGTLAVVRRSIPHTLFLVTWLAAYVVVKGASPVVNVEAGTFLRLLMPAFPAVCLLVAAVPLLWPRSGVHLPERFPALRRRIVQPWPVLAGTAVLLGLVPLAVIGIARIQRPAPAAKFFIENIYLPLSPQIDVKLTSGPRGIKRLTWTSPPTHGDDVFFRIFRSPTDQIAFQGNPPQPGDPSLPHGHYGVRCLPLSLAPNDCRVEMNVIATTREHRFAEGLGPGDWTYRVGMAANYADDDTLGDVMILSPPVRVVVH